MSLFKKSKPINALAMKDGSTFLHEGELKVGSEVQKAGELVDLEGEFSDADGNIVVIGEDNKVIEMKPKVVEEVEVSEEIVDQVAKILVDFETKIDAKLEAMKKTGSVAKVPKTEKPVEKTVSNQHTAGKGIQAKMAEIAEQKRKDQGLN